MWKIVCAFVTLVQADHCSSYKFCLSHNETPHATEVTVGYKHIIHQVTQNNLKLWS